MTASAPYDADPAGDITLLVGPDQAAIRVSSKVLSLASPVFAAMFSPKFAEGQALLTNKTSSLSPITITLPEDDAEAMMLFCSTVHFRKQATPDVSLLLLEKLASLCDKYDAARAISSASEVWMSPFKGTEDDERDFPRLLWISYVLGNHRAFWEFSRVMVRIFTKPELDDLLANVDNASFPAAIIRKSSIHLWSEALASNQ